MKTIVTSVFFLLTIGIFAQTGFYVRPVIEHKFHANNAPSYNITTLQGYTLKVDPINFYALKGFNIGLNIGFRTKNFFFETGWSQDQCNQGAVISGMTYSDTDSSFSYTNVTYKSGVAYNKIPVRVGLKLFGKDSVTSGNNWNMQGFLYGGVDFLIRSSLPLSKNEGTYYFVSDKNMDTLKCEASLGTQVQYGYLNTIGLMLKAQHKKGLVFNLSVQYSQGGKDNQASYTNFTFTNFDKNIYKAYVSSKGSGLYIGISTDIYMSELFKKKVENIATEEQEPIPSTPKL